MRSFDVAGVASNRTTIKIQKNVTARTVPVVCLDYQKYGLIQLTDKGRSASCFLLNRHQIIENFLRIIGVEEEVILQDTEMIEHCLSLNSIHKIKLLYQFVNANPAILKKFRQYMDFEAKPESSPG